METQTITFNISEETRPIIEKFDELTGKEYLFKDQYLKAFAEISRYLDQTRQAETEDRLLFLGKQNEQVNNIFAFIGERGSGKTSCMLSVANTLLDKHNNEVMSLYPTLKSNTFLGIDLIDPSFFDDKHNILSIVVAKLFKAFSDVSKNKCNDDKFDSRRKLIEKFEETQRNLKCLIEGKGLSDDDLDQLVSLSAAVDLKKNLFDLVAAYLEYMEHKDAKLLIMIDDIDLHTHEAREMAEQIRKYLIQPNVIVLMALKLDQLATIKRLHFANEFNNLLKDNKMSFDIVEEMVDRYLVKLIPYNQRIYLPEASIFSEARLTIKSNDDKSETFASIRQAIPMLIFRKTRYLFYNSKGNTSYIVPRNLRELRQLIKLLFDMEDYVTDKGPEYNKTLFKKYLFDTWVANNLDHDGQKMIKEILHISDAAQINKRVLQLLQIRFKIESRKALLRGLLTELDYILRDENMAYNISIGDVIGIIDELERKFPMQLDQRFLFIIKAIYSIRLYEYYDQLTDSFETQENKQENSLDKEVLKNDTLTGFSNFEKLVAGRFVNSRLIEFLPTAKNEPSRSNRRINLAELNNLIKECVTGKSVSDELIRLAEFFILCTSRSYDSQNEGKTKYQFYDPSFRERRSQYYAESLVDKKTNAFFDINAFFFNITQIEKSYKRFAKGAELYDLANQTDKKARETLLYLLKTATVKRELSKNDTILSVNDYRPYRFLSWACIRNIDVLQDLTSELENVNYKNSDDFDILRTYFSKISNFSIKTYDKNKEEKDYYNIDFNFATVISNSLNTGSSPARKWFNKIYSYSDASEAFVYPPIDVDLILYMRKEEGNLTKTVKNKIKETYPEFESNLKLLNLLNTYFPDSQKYMSRTEIAESIRQINNELNG